MVKCPKCGAQNPDDSVNCSACGMRIRVKCPKCKTYNPLGAAVCATCGEILIKYCPECNSANKPDDKTCRMCGSSLADSVNGFNFNADNDDKSGEEFDNAIKEMRYPNVKEAGSQDELYQKLTEFYSDENSETRLLAVCAGEGNGKSFVVNKFCSGIKDKIVLKAKVKMGINYSPFAFFRDCFLNLLSLPSIHPDIKTFNNKTVKLFEEYFPYLSREEIKSFMNFLYPCRHEDFSDIFVNKNKIYGILAAVIDNISEENGLLLVIDDFEFIDSGSYEFFNYLIKSGKINKDYQGDFKVIAVYRTKYPFVSFVNRDIISKLSSETIALKVTEGSDFHNLILKIENKTEIPADIFDIINQKAPGNLKFAKTYLKTLINNGYLKTEENKLISSNNTEIPYIPETFNDILKYDYTGISDFELKKFLETAAIAGETFNAELFKRVLKLSENNYSELITKLTKEEYLEASGKFELSFCFGEMVSVILNEAVNMPYFTEICKKFHTESNAFSPNNAIKVCMSEYLNDYGNSIKELFELNGRVAATGDDMLFVILSKQYINSYDKIPVKERKISEGVRYEIEENIAKLLTDKAPDIAAEHFTVPMIRAVKNNNKSKLLELGGYAIRARYNTGNYIEAIQTTDYLVEGTSDVLNQTEAAMVKANKIEALIKCGNCAEAVFIIQNEILPVLNNALKDKKITSEYFLNEIIYSLAISKLNLAKASALQGIPVEEKIIDDVEKIIDENHPDYERIKNEILLTKAFVYTLKCNVNKALEYLDLFKNSQTKTKNQKLIGYITEIFLRSIYQSPDEILPSLLEYIEDGRFIGNSTDRQMLEVFEALFLMEKGLYEKAMKKVNYLLPEFAKKKIVTGALACWYITAKTGIKTPTDNDSYSIATSASEIAGNPNFMNYNFMIAFQKLIAEILAAKKDFSGAEIQLEKAMATVKKTGFTYAALLLSEDFADLSFEKFSENPSNIINNPEKFSKISEKISGYKNQLNLPQSVNKISKRIARRKKLWKLNRIPTA